MSSRLEYKCTGCKTKNGDHEFGCDYEEYDQCELERAYTDILSVLSSSEYECILKIDLVGQVECMPNGDWTELHGAVLDSLRKRGLVVLEEGRYTLPEESEQSMHLTQESSQEKISNALYSIDPDIGHDEWVNLGFSVYCWDSTEVGKALFRDWSKKGSKYDRKAKEQIDQIWKTGSDKITLSTLAYHAKRHGW